MTYRFARFALFTLFCVPHKTRAPLMTRIGHATKHATKIISGVKKSLGPSVLAPSIFKGVPQEHRVLTTPQGFPSGINFYHGGDGRKEGFYHQGRYEYKGHALHEDPTILAAVASTLEEEETPPVKKIPCAYWLITPYPFYRRAWKEFEKKTVKLSENLSENTGEDRLQSEESRPDYPHAQGTLGMENTGALKKKDEVPRDKFRDDSRDAPQKKTLKFREEDSFEDVIAQDAPMKAGEWKAQESQEEEIPPWIDPLELSKIPREKITEPKDLRNFEEEKIPLPEEISLEREGIEENTCQETQCSFGKNLDPGTAPFFPIPTSDQRKDQRNGQKKEDFPQVRTKQGAIDLGEMGDTLGKAPSNFHHISSALPNPIPPGTINADPLKGQTPTLSLRKPQKKQRERIGEGNLLKGESFQPPGILSKADTCHGKEETYKRLLGQKNRKNSKKSTPLWWERDNFVSISRDSPVKQTSSHLLKGQALDSLPRISPMEDGKGDPRRSLTRSKNSMLSTKHTKGGLIKPYERDSFALPLPQGQHPLDEQQHNIPRAVDRKNRALMENREAKRREKVRRDGEMEGHGEVRRAGEMEVKRDVREDGGVVGVFQRNQPGEQESRILQEVPYGYSNGVQGDGMRNFWNSNPEILGQHNPLFTGARNLQEEASLALRDPPQNNLLCFQIKNIASDLDGEYILFEPKVHLAVARKCHHLLQKSEGAKIQDWVHLGTFKDINGIEPAWSDGERKSVLYPVSKGEVLQHFIAKKNKSYVVARKFYKTKFNYPLKSFLKKGVVMDQDPP